MDWLGHRCGFQKICDWYQLNRMHFRKNFGGGLLMSFYGDSPLESVKDYLPEYPWKPWLFKRTPQGFWQDRCNRVTYMDWLAGRLGFHAEADWYGIAQRDFFANDGGGLLATVYDFSPQAALHDYRPEYPWTPWLFRSVPKGFWAVSENRVWYLRWLGEKLGYQAETDWKLVRQRDFCENGGSGLLMNIYGGSPQRAVRELLDGRRPLLSSQRSQSSQFRSRQEGRDPQPRIISATREPQI